MQVLYRGSLVLSAPVKTGCVDAVNAFLSEFSLEVTKRFEFISDSRRFLRVEWSPINTWASTDEFAQDFIKVAEEHQIEFNAHIDSREQTVGVIATRETPNLLDLLNKNDLNYFENLNIAFLLSNNENLRSIADRHAIPFFLVSDELDSIVFEEQKLEIINRYQPSLLTLVGYEHVLSAHSLAKMPCHVLSSETSWVRHLENNDVYTSAYERGVRMIGATAKIVSADVSGGFIIEQGVERINVDASRAQLVAKAHQLEHTTLVKAIEAITRNQVLLHKNRAINFS